MIENQRYLPPEKLRNLSHLKIVRTGYSVEGKPIHLYILGSGDYKILAWSQMHGNETTTTRALLRTIDDIGRSEIDIENSISFYFILQLNPDGSHLYTRENFNGVDLNRDAKSLSQPESRFLRACFEDVNPDLCLNLHDQRTLFSAGEGPHEATVSFLSPSGDEANTFSDQRRKAIGVILRLYKCLNKRIPNKIGIFDDSFNINCTGDMFTSLGKPVILFEAGHYRMSYSRNETCKWIHKVLQIILQEAPKVKSANDKEIDTYLSIPKNQKKYLDIIVRDFDDGEEDIGIMFREVLENNSIKFEPYVDKRGDLSNFYGHLELRGEDLENFQINHSTLGIIDIKLILSNE